MVLHHYIRDFEPTDDELPLLGGSTAQFIFTPYKNANVIVDIAISSSRILLVQSISELWSHHHRMSPSLPYLAKSSSSLDSEVGTSSQSSIDLDRDSVSPEKTAGQVEECPPYHVYDDMTKVILISIVSVAATLSGLSSNIFFPTMTEVAQVG